MRKLMILILSLSLINCQSYKERFVSMHYKKENDSNCFWLQSIVNKEDPVNKSERIKLHYCCPNEDVNNKNIRPVCVSSKFLIYK